MKAFKIQTPYNYSQPYIVIADDFSKAEEVAKEKNPQITILNIEKIADYVDVQKES